MANKDEILANFQACSGIEDCGEAFTHLESCNWNLMEALANVMGDQRTSISETSLTDFDTSMDVTGVSRSHTDTGIASHEASIMDMGTSDSSLSELSPLLPRHSSVICKPSTSKVMSSSNPSVISLNIQVNIGDSSDGNSFPLELPGTATVQELKTMLYQLVGIPPCNQVLEGFVRPVEPDDEITLDLLPVSKTLCLNAGQGAVIENPYGRMNGVHEPDAYHILVHDETSGKDHNLRYSGSKLIREIKNDVYDITNISVRHQLWSGWPPSVSDDTTTLSLSGIGREHSLTVKSSKDRIPKSQKKVVVAVTDDNSSAEEFEDASDIVQDDYDFLDITDVPGVNKPQSLIPPDADDDIAALVHFSEEFVRRYGNLCPLFFQGTLEEALKSSVMLPAKDRKALAVYLHHDGSVLSNVFCSEVLCKLSVVDYLTANFVIWGWDLTHESNRSRLLNLITKHFGSVVTSTVRSFTTDKLPAVLIITRTRGATEVLTVINGNAVLDEVLTSLLHAHDMFEEQRLPEVGEEEQRRMREEMRAEQDAAYYASLEADRAKAEAKRRAELEATRERERQESIKQQEDALKEAVRASLETDLPLEPDDNCVRPLSTLRFRAPGGVTFTRKFLLDTPLEVVLNYLHVQGYPADEFKCLQSWPRRDVTSLNTSKTLQELDFQKQETLNIEEL